MEISIVIAEAREETRLLGPFAGRNDRDAVTMAMLLQELRPAATVVFIFGSRNETTAFTAAEILADRAEAERITQADTAKGQIQRGKIAAPKTFADIGPDYHAKLEAEVGAREQAQRDTRAIEGLGAALVEVMEERPPAPPRPDPDEDELATYAPATPRNPDDDEVARP